MVKKELVIVFVSLLLLGIVSADECSVKLASECDNDGENIVLRMSDTGNAHTELYNETNYNYALCCDFPSVDIDPERSCDVFNDINNTILRLSDKENAHVQEPNLTSYSVEVCYEDLVCKIQHDIDECYGNDLEMLSLSSETNAHVGNFSEYNIKVCCGHGDVTDTFPEGTGAYWTNTQGNQISKIRANPGETSVQLRLINGTPNTEVTFELKEDQFGLDGIKDFEGVETDSNGYAEVTWTITEEDLNEGSPDSDGNYEFYFVVPEEGDETSNMLNVSIPDCPESIVGCNDYENQGACESDECDVSDFFSDSCGNTWTEDGCTYETSCRCDWDESEGKCYFKDTTLVDCPDGPGRSILTEESGGIGSCRVTSQDSGECDEGTDFVEYTWEEEWEWGDNNNFTEEEINDRSWEIDDFVEDPENSGDYHYSPDDQHLGCEGDSEQMPCPAAIQLPFFGASTLIGALVVLAVIYYIIYQTNEKNSSKKSKKSKKK